MSADQPSRSQSEAEQRAAAAWAARTDRGLTAAEQDDYLQWLREDPRRGPLVAEHEQSLRRLEQLSQWRPGAGATPPNPDLFAPRRRWPRLLIPLAAAAVVVFAALERTGWRSPAPAASHLIVDEQRTLPDGSRVEFKDGSAVDVRYSQAERRVKLMGGEAVFTVRKNPQRPFVVEAAGVAVHAVGTVFDVKLDSGSVTVLVTEGKVRLDGDGRITPVSATAGGAVFVSAGECAVVPLAGGPIIPHIVRLRADKVSDDLGWEAPRFQFYETSLGDAVAEFNRYNRAQLTLSGSPLRSLPIGGTFRADDPAGFAHILETVVGLHSEPDGAGGFILTPGR